MAARLLSLVAVLASVAAASPYARQSDLFQYHSKRQWAMIDAGVSDDCTIFAPSLSPSDDCVHFESKFGLAHQVFVALNPSVKEDCSGIAVRHIYCVSVDPSAQLSSLASGGTSLAHGSNATLSLAPGSNTSLPLAQGFNVSLSLTPGYNMSLSLSKGLNASLALTPGSNVSLPLGKGLNASVALSPASNVTLSLVPVFNASSSLTPTATTQAAAPPTPSPIQGGVVADCGSYYKAVPGDNCFAITEKYGAAFSLAEFMDWNPAVGVDCSSLLAGYNYCVGLRSGSTRCSPDHPEPTQPGSVCSCKAWHKVAKGDVCYRLFSRYHISADDFYGWNPEVGRDCRRLWLGYNVCVGVS